MLICIRLQNIELVGPHSHAIIRKKQCTHPYEAVKLVDIILAPLTIPARIEGFAVFPVIRIPARLLPVHNNNLNRSEGGYDDISPF